MESEELKPCPFCGSSKIKALPPAFGAVRWCIVCDDCHASAGVLHGDSRAATIAAWNRRPTPPVAEARVIGPPRLQPYEGGALVWTGTADSITEPAPRARQELATFSDDWAESEAQAEAAERDEALYSREYHCGACGGVLGPEYSTCTCNDDPAAELRDNLRELVALARECGAAGVTIIRRPGKAQLNLRFDERVEGNSIKILDFAYPARPAGLLLVLRFAASDGGAAGVEVVE